MAKVELRVCLNFVFGGKKRCIFCADEGNFEGIAVAIAEKIAEISAKKTLF